MSNLLPELITDILCRLPVKSLLRFRCVSKPWCSQIEDPYFIKLQLNHSLKTNTNRNLILKDNDNDLFSVGLDGIDKAVKLNNPKHDDDYGTEVLGCCNGLLALALYNHFDDIALWNPYTNNYLELPFMGVEILRENCRSEFGFGFGYDPITDDYKFVWLVQFCQKDTDSFDSVVKVYSLKAASWTRIPDFPYHIRNNGDCGVLANNALHWVVTRKRESDTRNLIAGFDLGAGEYFEVPQPDNVYKFNVGVLGGCLCLCCNSVQVCVDIWVMKEYRVKESWTKLFWVAQQEVTRGLKFVRPLAYSKSGDKVLLHQDNQKFVWYDLRRKTAEKVRIQGVPKLFEAEMCVASLVPLGGQARIKKKNKNKNSGKKRKRRWWMDGHRWHHRISGDGKKDRLRTTSSVTYLF